VDDPTPLGERIAYYRRRRGLSQVKLAGLLGRSESWLSQVERGVRSIDRISVLTQVAAALNVPTTELSPDLLLQREEAAEHSTVHAIRMALSRYDALSGILGSPGAAGPIASPAQLEAGAERAWEFTHGSRYTELEEFLPALISEAEVSARRLTAAKQKAAFRSLAVTYQAAAAVMAKLREVDAGWVAGERSIAAAEQADAPMLAAAGAFRIAHVFLSGNRTEEALETARSAAAVLEPGVVEGPLELVAMWGALNLAGAVAATRGAQEDLARECMRNAEDAARQLGADRNDFHTEFGPTNVALHAVSIAVELGDAGEAIRRAATIDASKLSTERRARFLIDVARAYTQRRKVTETVRTVEEAEALAPEQVRSHPFVREMVRDLLRGERRRVQPELRTLAQRVGVLPTPSRTPDTIP
jgi:transcriptional regulator with XRE-family HTH domain